MVNDIFKVYLVNFYGIQTFSLDWDKKNCFFMVLKYLELYYQCLIIIIQSRSFSEKKNMEADQ